MYQTPLRRSLDVSRQRALKKMNRGKVQHKETIHDCAPRRQPLRGYSDESGYVDSAATDIAEHLAGQLQRGHMEGDAGVFVHIGDVRFRLNEDLTMNQAKRKIWKNDNMWCSAIGKTDLSLYGMHVRWSDIQVDLFYTEEEA